MCSIICLLRTSVDEQSLVQTYKYKVCDPLRYSFHSKQVLFGSIPTRLSYQHTKSVTHIHMHTHTRAHARTHVHTHMHARTHTRTHTHTHTHTHAYTHTHAHTCTDTHKLSWIRSLTKSTKFDSHRINNHTAQYKLLQYNKAQAYLIIGQPSQQ